MKTVLLIGLGRFARRSATPPTIEVAVPEDWRGHSIGELDIRRKYGVNILGVKRDSKTDVNISPKTVLDADMTLLVLGENQKLKKHFHL